MRGKTKRQVAGKSARLAAKDFDRAAVNDVKVAEEPVEAAPVEEVKEVEVVETPAEIVVEDMSNQDLLLLEEGFRQIEGVNKVISIADLTGTSIPIEILPKNIAKQFKDFLNNNAN